jgi:hypothetical protein
MRLRLFARLRRIVSWRSHDQDPGHARAPDSYPREDSGRHRRNPAVAPPRPTAPPQTADTGLLQPPAQLPRRTPQSQPPWPPQSPRPAQPLRPPQPPPGFAPRPAVPRNYGPPGPERPAGTGGGVGRARIREVPFGAAPLEAAAVTRDAHQEAQAPGTPRQPWYQVVGESQVADQQAQFFGMVDAAGLDPAATAPPAGNATPANGMGAARASRAALPFAAPHPKGHQPTADGRRNCGALEAILWRQWDAAAPPSAEVIAAVDRLAEFPRALQEKLAAGLDGIYVGDGGVPQLDDMAALHGVPLPSGRATWDACAGAYGERKIVVGSRPSPTPDVMCHEVGHALDDLDSPPGKWQSDSAEFRMIYDQCLPSIASDFHRQRGGLGRKEFFADAFAAIASAQRPALVDMLSGNTRIALRVMLYFNRRYGI